jgi:hypothetical protein
MDDGGEERTEEEGKEEDEDEEEEDELDVAVEGSMMGVNRRSGGRLNLMGAWGRSLPSPFLSPEGGRYRFGSARDVLGVLRARS